MMISTKILCSVALLWLCIPAATRADDYQRRFFAESEDVSLQQTDAQIRNSLKFNPSLATSSGILDSNNDREVSRGGAMLRSLLVPGWGEAYLGYRGTARWFFIAEAAIWTAVIGLESYSNWTEDQFMAFAATHSKAQMRGKSDGFYADFGNYDNTEVYNAAKLRERNYTALYTTPDHCWAWDSAENRLEYDELRVLSKSAHNKVYFFIGAAVLNRLISFIDTGKKARDILGAERSPQLGVRLQPEIHDGASSVRLAISASW